MPQLPNGDNFEWVRDRGALLHSLQICAALDTVERNSSPQRKAAALLIARHIIWQAKNKRCS